MTREQERIKFAKKQELAKGYGLVCGLIAALKTVEKNEEIVKALEELKEVLEKNL